MDTLPLESAVETLLFIVSLRVEGEYGHAMNVTQYAIALAEKIDMSAADVYDLSIAGRLHDIGKLGILGSVLSKSASLNRAEWAMVKQHPIFSAEILTKIGMNGNIVRAVRWHHENSNGTGYPDGLSGDEIIMQARILKIADVYDALRSDRPYRKAIGHRQAIDFMWRLSSNFDTTLLDVFERIEFPEMNRGLP